MDVFRGDQTEGSPPTHVPELVLGGSFLFITLSLLDVGGRLSRWSSMSTGTGRFADDVVLTLGVMALPAIAIALVSARRSERAHREWIVLVEEQQLERRRDRLDEAARRERASTVRSLLSVSERLHMLFQPIIDLAEGEVVGYEALARFDTNPYRPPDNWFADAADLGMGVELELLAFRAAIAELDYLPDNAYLSVNFSPETLTSDAFLSNFDGVPADRIVVELTEHAFVGDYERANEILMMMRGLGARLAVDDAGAGFASFRHILRLAPDIIKLDRELTCAIHDDPARQSLTEALVRFADDVGASIVAEGIEDAREAKALRKMDVGCGQGFFLGRPARLPGRPGPLVPAA